MKKQEGGFVVFCPPHLLILPPPIVLLGKDTCKLFIDIPYNCYPVAWCYAGGKYFWQQQ